VSVPIAGTTADARSSRSKKKSKEEFPLKIVVDAMGGDKGPEVVAKAAFEAIKSDSSSTGIILVGDKRVVEDALDSQRANHVGIEVVHASETIAMSEAPASAVRRKKNSSIAVAMRLIKEGKADAMVSAGNTGAVVASSLVTLGRLHGISRPAIMTFVPTARGGAVVLDVGANSECTPKNLLQFAMMGSVFVKYQLQTDKPRIGLLNIGEESSKGNEMVREAHKLLEASDVHFVGNVEGRDVFSGAADVVVCDGFVGNIVLKFSESILAFVSHLMRQEIKKSMMAKMGAMMLKGVFSSFRAQLDYAEYGGAPLLGINGIVIISHGKSSVRAMKNAIILARRFAEYDINGHIENLCKGMVNKPANVSQRVEDFR
jgi:glycerol-3-phosphate acyltransferase PlsX